MSFIHRSVDTSEGVNSGPAFCPHCGTILDLSETANLLCTACGFSCHYEEMASAAKVILSEAQPDPQWLETDKDNAVKGPARATVEETCPKCNNPEMDYYTMQLRSADEGQTVFYECKKCGYKYSVNN